MISITINNPLDLAKSGGALGWLGATFAADYTEEQVDQKIADSLKDNFAKNNPPVDATIVVGSDQTLRPIHVVGLLLTGLVIGWLVFG